MSDWNLRGCGLVRGKARHTPYATHNAIVSADNNDFSDTTNRNLLEKLLSLSCAVYAYLYSKRNLARDTRSRADILGGPRELEMSSYWMFSMVSVDVTVCECDDGSDQHSAAIHSAQQRRSTPWNKSYKHERKAVETDILCILVLVNIHIYISRYGSEARVFSAVVCHWCYRGGFFISVKKIKHIFSD